MGIDIKAAIFVGLPREEIEHEELQDLIDSGVLDACPPHYDGNSEDYAIVGLELAGSGRYEPREFIWDAAKCDDLMAKFKEITGQDAKVWISPNVY